jgi:hypothetical protein
VTLLQCVQIATPGEIKKYVAASGGVALVLNRDLAITGGSKETPCGSTRCFLAAFNPDTMNSTTIVHELSHILHGHGAIPVPDDPIGAMIVGFLLDVLITPAILWALGPVWCAAAALAGSALIWALVLRIRRC